MKFKLKELLYGGAILTAAIFAVNYLLINVFKQQVGQLFVSVPATQVVSATSGTTLMNFLGGYLPLSALGSITGAGWFLLFVSSLIVLFIGQFLVGILPDKVSSLGGLLKGRYGKIASVLFWGTLLGYLYFVGFVAPNTMVAIGWLVHMAATIFVATVIAGLLKVDLL